MAAEQLAVLEFLTEPALLLQPGGTIIGANRAARRLLGPGIAGSDLADFATEPAEEIRRYLSRCSGSTDPSPAAVTLRRADGTDLRLRSYGARLREPEAELRIVLRLFPAGSDQFSVLARKVRDLNSEIHQRRRAQAALEEALHQNEILLRELQHRVKNNMQMLLGLFSAAQRETKFEEVKSFLDEVAQRLMAVVTAQQLMYQSSDFRVVEAVAFLRDLCGAVGKTYDRNVRLHVSAFDGHLPNDAVFPLALILNELLTNAYKYGVPEGAGEIRVELRRDEESYALIVQDSGPGIPPGEYERRSSGLGLVRGLCRQIGGSFTIENVGGARCVVRVAA